MVEFCKACGASIPHRLGEGRCPECIHHLPATEPRTAVRNRGVRQPNPATDSRAYMIWQLWRIVEVIDSGGDIRWAKQYALDALDAAGEMC